VSGIGVLPVAQPGQHLQSWLLHTSERLGEGVKTSSPRGLDESPAPALWSFRTIPNSFWTTGKYMGDNAKVDIRTLMLLTIGSYVARKLFGQNKAAPHRTTRW